MSLGGRGQLRDWEIFNRPGKGRYLPYTFFSLWARPEDGQPVARLLEARFQPPYSGAFGVPHLAAGLPRLASARFTGSYPFAHIEFDDEALPLRVGLEAFNPFIPGDPEDSGIPVAIFLWTLTNGQRRAVQATVALSLMNAVGYDGVAPLHARRSHLHGQNLNQVSQTARCGGCACPAPSTIPGMRASAPWPSRPPGRTLRPALTGRAPPGSTISSASGTTSRRTGAWSPSDESPTPDGETDIATLGLIASLAPGETVTAAVHPGLALPEPGELLELEEAVRGKRLGN